MSGPFGGKAVITGAGKSQVGRRLGRTGLDLTIEAVTRAIADAGLSVDDVDGVASYPGPGVPDPDSPVRQSLRSATRSACVAGGTCPRWRPPARSVRRSRPVWR
ncbi:diterpenoid dioxygenase domain protein [Mycobacterium xenopi 3993]|nr:diterpenoid dioxygenase domain protein [Mycobacterium xenopi 3993]